MYTCVYCSLLIFRTWALNLVAHFCLSITRTATESTVISLEKNRSRAENNVICNMINIDQHSFSTSYEVGHGKRKAIVDNYGMPQQDWAGPLRVATLGYVGYIACKPIHLQDPACFSFQQKFLQMAGSNTKCACRGLPSLAQFWNQTDGSVRLCDTLREGWQSSAHLTWTIWLYLSFRHQHRRIVLLQRKTAWIVSPLWIADLPSASKALGVWSDSNIWSTMKRSKSCRNLRWQQLSQCVSYRKSQEIPRLILPVREVAVDGT